MNLNELERTSMSSIPCCVRTCLSYLIRNNQNISRLLRKSADFGIFGCFVKGDYFEHFYDTKSKKKIINYQIANLAQLHLSI